MSNPRLNLHGQWKRSVGGRQIDFVTVPGSYPPVGACELELEFDRPWPAVKGERDFLVTEGVLASAEFTLNGTDLGKAGPWATYRFEFPEGLLRDRNVIVARVRDILDDFGPTPGRRFDGGLVRDIRLERRPKAFLEDMAFRAELSPDFARADCSVTVEIDGKAAKPVAVELRERDTGRIVAQAEATANAPARFSLEWPRLWSPALPHLYTLTASLPGKTEDRLQEQVGFRRIETRGPDFFLNGKRLFLKGVCRHEFTDPSGYSPSPAEVRRELAMIKQAGFNYIRLVHSPQAPCVSRLAAELGILVSEEPGTCFHDLANEAIYAPAFECLKRTVKRDRNVPSIFAWLIYNECNPNTEYAVKAAKVCREMDPGCRLAMADCSGQHDAIKAMVQAADLTFYGINLYSVWPKDYVERMRLYADRPIVFTEWGGGMIAGNPRLLRDLGHTFVAHAREDESVRLAGCSFWAWTDYEEHSRPRPCAIDGWTVEGLTQPDMTPRPDLQTLSAMFFDIDNPLPPAVPRIEILAPAPRRETPWQTVPLDGLVAGQAAPAAEVDAVRRSRLKYDPWHTLLDPRLPVLPRFGRLLIDGIEFACRDIAAPAHPLLLGKGCEEVVIPVNRDVRGLAVLGHVALRGGYPASAIWSVHHRDAEAAKPFGTPAAEYAFEFADGEDIVPLRHGIEILRANNITRWWTPEPRAPATRPALRTVIDKSYEVLRVDLWEREFPKTRRLAAVRWRLKDPEAILALWALSVRS